MTPRAPRLGAPVADVIRIDATLYASVGWSPVFVYGENADLPIDLTGYGAVAEFAYGEQSAAVLTLSTDDDSITWVEITEGSLQLHVTAASAATLGLGRRGVYTVDLIDPDGLRVPLARGFWEVAR